MKNKDNISKNNNKNNSNNKNNFSFKKAFKPIYIALIILILIIIFSLCFLIHNYHMKSNLEKDYLEKAELNEKEIFSISKIYCYNSGSATTNKTNKPQWDLNISQFSDIAIYLQADTSNGLNEENTIKSMAIHDIKIGNNENNNENLYFKNLSSFGKFDYSEENKIDDILNYEIINSYELDYSKPQIYMGANNPIALQFVRKNINKNYIIKDLSTPIIFDGHILKQANISPNALAADISFKISIINQANQEFVANVFLPLNFDQNDSIYEGYSTNEIINPNIHFYRIK